MYYSGYAGDRCPRGYYFQPVGTSTLMVSKIIAFACTFLVNVVIGVAILFFMLIAMNGYSESDAAWGLGVYTLLATIVALAMSIGAFFFVNYLTKKNSSNILALLISITVFSIIGFLLEIVCSLVGVGLAELVRVKF